MRRTQINRSLLTITLLAFFCAGGNAESKSVPDSIAWQSDYRKAQDRRVSENRPMLVFIMSDHCSHCHRMMASTYVESDVVREVQDGFVPTLVNASKNAKLAEAFKVRVYPTTFLVGSDNKIVDRIEGYADGETLRKRIAMHTNSDRLAQRAE
jgi:thioredoxin-related protein